MKIHRLAGILAFALVAVSARAEEFTDTVKKQFSLQPGGTLSIEADFGHIEFKSGSSSDVIVEVTRRVRTSTREEAQRIFNDFDLTGTGGGNNLTIKGEFKEGWQRRDRGSWGRHGYNNCHSRNGEQVCLTYAKELRQHSYTITIPRKLDLSVRTQGGHISAPGIDGKVFARSAGGHIEFGDITGTADISTAGGHIEVGNIGARADIRTAGGHISVRNVNGELDAETAGGSISTGDVEGKVRANTAGGSINIESAKGSIQAHTSGGSINAKFASQPKEDSAFETSGGNVSVAFAPGIGANVEADSSNGRVMSDFDEIQTSRDSRWRGEARGAINGGGPRVRISTSSGSVRLTRAAL